MAPRGHSLVQAHLGLRLDENLEAALDRIERLLDETIAGWRERVAWRRRQLVTDSSGAVDLPGTTWRDRPAIVRGDGVFLAGDMVAAPGLLAEVAWASAIEAGRPMKTDIPSVNRSFLAITCRSAEATANRTVDKIRAELQIRVESEQIDQAPWP